MRSTPRWLAPKRSGGGVPPPRLDTPGPQYNLGVECQDGGAGQEAENWWRSFEDA
jgi:hypothetical protein